MPSIPGYVPGGDSEARAIFTVAGEECVPLSDATVTRVVIVGSAPVAPGELIRIRTGADLLICADGGADAALAAGLRPDLVVGDMDSISDAARARYQRDGVGFIEHPVAKDETDIELAITLAIAHAPSSITIAGALGGPRLDHTVGNLMLLALPALRGIDIRIVDAATEALAVWDRREIIGSPGDYITLLPLTARVEGVRTEGLLYPLHGETLLQGHTRGVSNELVAERASVRIQGGCLLLIRESRNLRA